MANDPKKTDSKTLAKELLPYFVGIRNEIKALADKIKFPEVSVDVKLPEVQSVKVVNEVKEVSVINPVKSVEVIGLSEFVSRLLGHLERGNTDIPNSIGALQELIRAHFSAEGDREYKVKVINQEGVKFPEIQRVEIVNEQKQLSAIRVTNSQPSEAVPVILVSKNGKSFYDAISEFMAMGTDINLAPTNALLTQIRDGQGDITIDADAINLNTDEIEEKLDTIITALASVAVTGPLTDAQLRAAAVPTKEVRPATPAQSSVSVLTSSTVILASNANRLGATLYNESGATAFVKLGGSASLTSYSIQVAVGGYYEVPFGYTGAIDGITSAITAVFRVTELTA